MDITDILEIPQTQEALYILAKNLQVTDFLNGKHKVLQRKDFIFKGETLFTSKIVLQTVKSIVDFHTAYLVGNPCTLTGNDTAVKAFSKVYNKNNYALTDFTITDNLVKYGNAFEYVYSKDKAIYSKVFDPLCSYPVYDDKGLYRAFVEHWGNINTGNQHYIVYDPEKVTEYSTVATGNLIKVNEYINLTGLPIHYTSGVQGVYDKYGVGVVADLIPIINELEQLLSKTTDAVTTLSLNPLGVCSGQKIEAKVDKDVTGAILTLEDGGRFAFASANIDSATVKFLIEQLINQLYAVAQVPSVVFNGNVSNVSEVSLKLLFTQLDNKAKRTAINLKEGFYTRWLYIRKLMANSPITDDDFDSLDVVFNFNRPTDNTAIINDLEKQFNAGAMSKKTFIEKSPYTENAENELKQIQLENEMEKKTNAKQQI